MVTILSSREALQTKTVNSETVENGPQIARIETPWQTTESEVGLSENRGTLFWEPYNKYPTI